MWKNAPIKNVDCSPESKIIIKATSSLVDEALENSEGEKQAKCKRNASKLAMAGKADVPGISYGRAHATCK